MAFQAILDQKKSMIVYPQQFTNSEIYVFRPLLESYPHFCPYEVLLASFNSDHITEQAQELGVWDQEMRPMRNVLSRTRLKIHTFGIDIFSILVTAYVRSPCQVK
jgi:hypothetical protein